LEKNIDYQVYSELTDDVFVSAEDCFAALTADQNELVEKSTTTLLFSKGETIIKQGYVATHVLFIEKGLARLDVTDDHKTSTVRLLSKGSFVGIICSFACKSVDFSATALEETTIRMINMDLFQNLVKENGEFALKLIRHMSTNTNSMVHWISRLAAKNVEGSLAMVLQEFGQVYGTLNFTLPVTRIGLAAMAGCSKESAINVLARFHSDGIIELKEKHVTIVDPQRLDLIIRQG
jgi:CRP-like cAMP-binding protein